VSGKTLRLRTINPKKGRKTKLKAAILRKSQLFRRSSDITNDKDNPSYQRLYSGIMYE
jgi:hypothetical protein